MRSSRNDGIALALMALVCGLPSAAARAASQPVPAMLSVAVEEANFRDGPSQQHNIVFTAVRHFPVKVVERTNGWVKVEDFEGDHGWVAAHLLTEDPAVIVTATTANLRREPSTESDIVGTAEHAEVYRVLARRERWLKLSAEDEERGWIRDDLVWGD